MRFYGDKLVLGGVSLVLHIIKEGTLNPRISALRISREKLKPNLSNFNAWFNFFQLPSPHPRYNPRGCNLFVLHGGIFFSPGRAQGIW